MLYYPTFYEGLEQSKNVIYTGQEATQQIIAGLDWVAKEKKAKTFFLIGSDYIWPRTSNKIARKHIENFLKGKVVGEEYYPLGHTQFNSLINKIKLHEAGRASTPIVVGGSQRRLLQAAQGGRHHRRQADAADHLGDRGRDRSASAARTSPASTACMKYFQSLDNPNNKKFVAAFKAKYGREDA